MARATEANISQGYPEISLVFWSSHLRFTFRNALYSKLFKHIQSARSLGAPALQFPVLRFVLARNRQHLSFSLMENLPAPARSLGAKSKTLAVSKTFLHESILASLNAARYFHGVLMPSVHLNSWNLMKSHHESIYVYVALRCDTLKIV